MLYNGQDYPSVSVIIPHHNGREILLRCLSTLMHTNYPNFEVILVDNGSTDDSVELAKRAFPQVRVLSFKTNLGFAGGCNAGVKESRGDYVLFLNNDTEVEPDWLSPLVRAMEKDPVMGGCQSKILSLQKRNFFDYSGGAGGLIDIFGYPFVRGRVFQTIEEDKGQYDESREIFWASGSCALFRKKVLAEVGLLDEDFFAHMEEIDLAWRMHLRGYKIISVPSSRIYHLSGATLPADNPRKMYLNHRNSLIMLIKNSSRKALFLVLPGRLVLELITFLYAFFLGKYAWAFSVLKSLGWLFSHPQLLWRKRREIKGMRKTVDGVVRKKMFKGSVVIEYFLLGKKRATQICPL